MGCKYHQHFNDAEKKIRAGSTFAYLGMLESWLMSSSFAFLPDTGKEFKDCYHQFDEYLKAYLKHSESIANEFPEMHQHIVQALYELDEKKNLDKTFPHIKKNLFDRMRDKLFSDDYPFVNRIREPHKMRFSNLLSRLSLKEHRSIDTEFLVASYSFRTEEIYYLHF